MCTRPNYMVWLGEFYPDTHKEKFHFMPNVNYEKILKSGFPFVQVPCGSCLECKQQNSSMWADRCVFEAMNNENNYFITLTYDEENCPASLDKKVIPDFMDRLRHRMKYKYGETDIKYFGCGEYGTGGQRGLNPHYHILVFNLNLKDLSDTFYHMENGREKKCLRPNKRPENKFSREIWTCWNKLGVIDVSPVNYQTAAYVAGYVEKKANKKYSKKLKDLGLLPEFHLMSKNLGKSAFSPDMFNKESLIIPKSGQAKISVIPRYYEKLLDKEYPFLFNDLKERQSVKRQQRLLDYEHSSRFKDIDNFARAKRNTIKFQRKI